MTYTLFATDVNAKRFGCDQLELWAGWKMIKSLPLRKSVKPGRKGSVTRSKPPWSEARSSFTVTLASGKKQKYPLADLLGR